MIAGEELYGELYFATKEQYKGKARQYILLPLKQQSKLGRM